MQYTISQDCLFDYVFSDASGNSLEVAFEEASSDDGGEEEASCPDGTQVCLSLDGTSLNYSSSEDIGGFQFSHNGCVTSASGGDAAANGFAISSSGTAVIAFSFTGAVIPAGAGTLVELGGNISEDCLFDFVFSDASGNGLDVALMKLRFV